MPNWIETMEDRFWLHPDGVGGEEARYILGTLGLRPGDAVMDAPCGAGRIPLHLARAGCVVTGIDLRDTFVRRARRRFRAAGLHGTFRLLDLGGVNGVTGSQWGHCSFMRGFESDRQPRNVATSLSPDGQKRQDQTRGAFFESRFKSEAVITVCAYIDLNPVAARIAQMPEPSEHTSIKQRGDHVQAQGRTDDLAAARAGSVAGSMAAAGMEESFWLCPIEDRRRLDSSREGMVEGFSLGNYLLLVAYTGRLFARARRRSRERFMGRSRAETVLPASTLSWGDGGCS
jgi:hypothetical protein